MMRAGIALGSNLGDRLATMEAARRKVERLAGIEPRFLASAVYETEPVDCGPDAGAFYNAVVEIGYAADAFALLRALRRIEAALGREPRHARNESRTLDLDLLYCGDLVLATPELELPHPRMTTRRFVLEPLAEIRPELVLPGEVESVSDLLAQLPDRSPLVRVTSEW